MEDSGKRLTCRAANPLMPDSAVEDSWRLEIYREYLKLLSNSQSRVLNSLVLHKRYITGMK